MDYAEFVAIGLRERNDARTLTPSFERLWPVDRAPCFDGLLRAIDQADWRLRNQRACPN